MHGIANFSIKGRNIATIPSPRPRPPHTPSTSLPRPHRLLVSNAMHHRQGPRMQNRGRNLPPPVPINDMIRASEIRVISENKEPLGVMSYMEAQAMANDAGVDLVLVVPDASPPVARLIEISKYRYELTKADKENKKKQRDAIVETKELKLRPATDVHDYQVRVRAAQKFLEKGQRVKLTLQFRGREMAHQDVGRDMFNRFVEDMGEAAVVEADAKMVGRQMTMVLGPKKDI
jgi:translation initiation factor IF-3